MGAALLAAFRRDVLQAWRRQADWLTTFFFFILVVSLFPLGVGPEPSLLRTMAPGIVWVAALLAAMLSLPRVFSGDFQDGSLEQLVLSCQPLPLLVLAKVSAHWLLSGIPLALMAPVLGVQFGLEGEALGTLFWSLVLGTPCLSLIGSVGAALTLGVRGGGVLVALLVLPLYIPVLIFGSGAVEAVISGTGAGGHLSLLGACLCLSLVVGPLAAAAAVRVALE
ncbi:MAG: heme exporter protein CcmB [Betaproteobacteria bacterium]|jgi:heme exporter protein B